MDTKKGKALLTTGIAVIVIALAGIIVWYAAKHAATPSAPQGQTAFANHPTSTIPNDTSSWKVYTNNQIGYAVKYPPSWTQTSSTIGTGTNSVECISIYNPSEPYDSGMELQEAEPEVTTSSLTALVDDYMSNYSSSNQGYGWTYTAPSPATIAGQSAMVTDLTSTLNGKPFGKTRFVFFLVNSSLFQISYPLQQVGQDLSNVQVMLANFSLAQNG